MSKDGRRVRIFSALEVANICGVVNQTAINWIRNGHLDAFTTPGGQYRIYAKDLAAFLDKRGMNASGEVLQVMMENANWNNFLIAAEDQYNQFLKVEIAKLFPEFTIIQAFDWFEVGRKLAEDKPGYLLLDTVLPGVDVSKFVREVKSDPFFGKPNVYLLAGSNPGFKADLILAKPPDLRKLETAIRGMTRQYGAAANL
jgi:excisionase family DNA binding protein